MPQPFILTYQVWSTLKTSHRSHPRHTSQPTHLARLESGPLETLSACYTSLAPRSGRPQELDFGTLNLRHTHLLPHAHLDTQGSNRRSIASPLPQKNNTRRSCRSRPAFDFPIQSLPTSTLNHFNVVAASARYSSSQPDISYRRPACARQFPSRPPSRTPLKHSRQELHRTATI